jgi:hypothetical protein
VPDWILQRDDVTAARSFGTFLAAADPSIAFESLEPGANDNATDQSSIPALPTRFRIRNSKEHGHAVYGGIGIEGRSDIEIHSLNWVKNPETGKLETKGCIGLGLTRGKLDGCDAILQSHIALGRFMTAQGCPEYLTLKGDEAVEAWALANPDAAEFTLTIFNPPTVTA